MAVSGFLWKGLLRPLIRRDIAVPKSTIHDRQRIMNDKPMYYHENLMSRRILRSIILNFIPCNCFPLQIVDQFAIDFLSVW